MKVRFFYLLTPFLNPVIITGNLSHPITLVVHNKTNEPLNIGLEYEISQYYYQPNTCTFPFVPHHSDYHHLETLLPDDIKQITITSSSYYPHFCFLEKNLHNYGFKPYYKVIQGTVTIHDWKRSYDFTSTVLDGNSITYSIEPHQIIANTTHQFDKNPFSCEKP